VHGRVFSLGFRNHFNGRAAELCSGAYFQFDERLAQRSGLVELGTQTKIITAASQETALT